VLTIKVRQVIDGAVCNNYALLFTFSARTMYCVIPVSFGVSNISNTFKQYPMEQLYRTVLWNSSIVYLYSTGIKVNSSRRQIMPRAVGVFPLIPTFS
jgi:hypothetical protein